MTTINEHVSTHLSETGKSMRALSLEAGHGEKWIADLLSGKSKRPGAAALDKLSAIIGADLAAIPVERLTTAADMLRLLRDQPPAGWSISKVAGSISALNFYVTASGASGADATILERGSLRAWLSATTAAAVGLTGNTFTVYASHLRAVLGLISGGVRPRQIRDVRGPWRALHDALKGSKDNKIFLMGPFCTWCDAAGIAVADTCPATFAFYLDHRLATGKLTADASKHRRIAMEVYALWIRLAEIPEFSAMGVRHVCSPFVDGRDKYGMPSEFLAPLLREFDDCVLPWTRGETTPSGQPVDEVLDALDPTEVAPVDAKKARLRAFVGRQTRVRRRSREDRLRAAGVLLKNGTWNKKTADVARAGVVSLAKALWAKSETIIESIEELTDPEILEAAATALDEANDEERIGSSYVEHLLKRVKKLAGGYIKRGPVDMESIASLISDFTPDFAGVAPRNKRKLQQLTRERIDHFLRMSGEITAEVNAILAKRRRAQARAGSGTSSVLDAELAGRLEICLAHDIMLTRAPRPGNLLDIDLASHVRRRADGGVTIELPAALVKTKIDLAIPLGPKESAFFDTYVELARPLLLDDRNVGNTRLFPARYASEGHYTALTKRLIDEIHRRVGLRIHPHLYRHILGWIWLREDPNALPAVQKLLGHRRLETTMTFYAELDETLALQQWADILEEKKNATPLVAPRSSDCRRGNASRRAAG